MPAFAPAIERFDRHYIPEPNSGCWLWTSALNRKGYGKFDDETRNLLAHRFSYEMHRGPIPAGLEIDHKCRVRCCVNPDHLEPVTHEENVRRGGCVAALTKHRAVQRAKTHCPHGHEYDEANTYLTRSGTRGCRRCHAYHQRAANHARRSA